ncbi:MAG: hypothetical protein EOM37_03140 [Proteobacteria bacterium]|jgi:FMN phosphatase YigB (HAD superfamily)|nr:hypothetical protein [Alphaproteobacteria bacterium]NCC03031.1 hypothetical protein [Pseudomonadota bacterium]
MSLPAFQDLRIKTAAQQLQTLPVKLLAVDVFDTLLIRRVPKPFDVFLFMGQKLQQSGLLMNGQTPESFAAIRYQTEYAARGTRQRENDDREVRLEEIYELFPPHIVSLGKAAMTGMEIDCEKELIFANPDVVTLIELANQMGTPICMISNMYMQQERVIDLVRHACPYIPDKIEDWFVSSDYRINKQDGLLQKMCDHFKLQPDQILFIGDNPVSDRSTARNLGLHFVDLVDDPTLEDMLTDEQPREWRERSLCYGKYGDDGMTWLRRRAANEPHENDYVLYGKRMVGPLLNGFSAWTAAKAKHAKVPMLYGLLREGELLTQLVKMHAPELPVSTLATSRLAAALASFSPEHPAFLQDFLTRRGHWTLGMLMLQLGFDQDQTRTLGDPNATLEALTPLAMTRMILSSPFADQLYEKSKTRRDRFLKYLGAIGALDDEKLYLMDLGYAATIQRAIQRIFTIEKIPVTTHGFYLVTAHVSRITQEAGGIVEGFLAQNGNPNAFASGFCRCPEVIELSCMPSYGSVEDYDDKGEPLFDDNSIPMRQKEEIAHVQKGILSFAQAYLAHKETNPLKRDYTDTGWKLQMRYLAERLVIHPTAEEAMLFGNWLADTDMGLNIPRPIVSAATQQKHLASLSPAELVAMPRRDVPWLFGVAAMLGYAYVRQCAQIYMRLEKPEAFAHFEHIK